MAARPARALAPPRPRGRHAAWWVTGLALTLSFALPSHAAHAAPAPAPATPVTVITPTTLLPGAPEPTPTTTPPTLPAPASPKAPTTTVPGSQITVNLGNTVSKPSESLTIIIFLTLLSVAPALLIMLTSF